MKHAALIILLAVTAGTAAGSTQAATQRPGLYWSKATMTALFNNVVQTQQVGRSLPTDAVVTVSCQGLARYDGINGAPDFYVTKTGVRKFRYFLCTARSSCWVGGRWQVRYMVLLDATPSMAINATRVRPSQENIPHVIPGGC